MKPAPYKPASIRRLRREIGLTQAGLADQCEKVSQETISRLERGLIAWTQPTLEALALALETTPAELLREPRP